jgi:chromosome segregation ATPase
MIGSFLLHFQVEEMQHSIEDTKEKLGQVKKDRDVAKKDLDVMIQIEEKRAEAAALEKVLAWAAVKAMEGQMETMKTKIAAGPPLIEVTEAELKEAQDNIESLSEILDKEVGTPLWQDREGCEGVCIY